MHARTRTDSFPVYSWTHTGRLLNYVPGDESVRPGVHDGFENGDGAESHQDCECVCVCVCVCMHMYVYTHT